MAFVNRKFTEQEKKEIAERKITNHFYFWKTEYLEHLYCGTIDEEKRIYLLFLGRHREETSIYFVLIADEWTANFVMTQQIQRPDIIIWSIVSMKILSETNVSEESVLELLKEALTEYKWTGFFDERINGSANVEFEF